MTPLKSCSRCGQAKAVTREFFSRHSGTADGFQGVCKACRNLMRNLQNSKKREVVNRQQQLRRSKLPDEMHEKMRERARDWYAANSDRAKRNARDRRRAIRCEMIEAYGGSCECCGETESGFLTLDHTNDDGATHRRTLSGFDRAGNNYVIMDLRRRGWPKDGFSLLCYNCNCGRARNGGVCPHLKVPQASQSIPSHPQQHRSIT